MTDHTGFVTLHAGETSLVLACARGERPRIIYWGAKLASTSPRSLVAMTTRQHAPGSADIDIRDSLLNETGTGMESGSGFLAHRQGTDWATLFCVTEVRHPEANTVEIVCEDKVSSIRAIHSLSLDPDSEVLSCHTEIENLGETDLVIEACAAMCLPIDPRASQIFGFTGRWANEFQRQPIAPFTGTYLRENKKGRTSHDSFPGLLVGFETTNEQSGACFAFHLGWSGNHRVRLDRLSDGRTFVHMGELFFPGELSLEPGAKYRTPSLYAGYSGDGFSALSRQFHRHLSQTVMDGRITHKPRPIHYNTWEAVYFDHDVHTLFQLADKAADVGAERFILDDGWFGARRNDKAGLGDWWVSKEVYPDGLGPLIGHVTALGMEFGIWFEPEMVNPDSDLFRQHPDWILQVEGVEQVPFRQQYVLDLSRPDVSDYLFDHIHKLLSAHPISYIKWDMNRDVHHPGSQGRPAIHKQTHALYALIDRLRAAHPDLEIESCSSGGARCDYEVLRRTDRIWTSDSNDALDRQNIQNGASHFFPLKVMGAHVGPAKCHITGRRLSMNLRVATALFGHMGMELNLLDEDAASLEVLKAGLALHKTHRALIHGGAFHRLDTPDHINAIGVVADDTSEALFSWCNLTGHAQTLPGRMYLPGLDSSRSYRTKIVWPSPVRSVSQPSIIEALDLQDSGTVLSGEALAQMGLQIPLLHPETCLIFHLEAV
jgi:alpha-galactosidase